MPRRTRQAKHSVLACIASLVSNKSADSQEHKSVHRTEDATDGGEVRTSLTSLVMGMAGGTRGLLP